MDPGAPELVSSPRCSSSRRRADASRACARGIDPRGASASPRPARAGGPAPGGPGRAPPRSHVEPDPVPGVGGHLFDQPSPVGFQASELDRLAVLGLHVADHGLDGGAALHLAADDLGDAAHLARDPDPELVRIAVSAIALVDVDAARQVRPAAGRGYQISIPGPSANHSTTGAAQDVE